MFTERDVLYARELRRDAMAFADKQRLIRQVTADRCSFAKRHERWLAQLGARLVAWGTRLQDRYASPTISPLAVQHK